MELSESALQLDRPTPLEAKPESAFPTYRRALIPLDGSAVAEAILPAFMKIARPLALEVVLFRVLPPILRQTVEGVSAGLATEAIEHISRDVEQYLSSIGKDFARKESASRLPYASAIRPPKSSTARAKSRPSSSP